jgi:hypothetical protein
MSPRAAWRLEGLGYTSVYDYVAGKADWVAAALPTEGHLGHSPRVIDAIDRTVPTCTAGELVCNVVARLEADKSHVCIVVNDRRVVLGRLLPDRLDLADGRTADDAMELGPVTVRADADLAETTERMRARGVLSLIVTNPDGLLLGLVRAEADGVRRTGG